MRGALLACLALAGLAACAAVPPPPEITSVRFARGHPAARGGALEPRPGAGLPRPDLRARERREARPPAALRGAGAGLPRARRRSPPTGPTSRRCSRRLRTEAGIDIAETGDPEAAQIRIEVVPAGADRPGLPHRRLLHRAGRDRLAELPAPPRRRAAALVGPGDARRRRRSSCRSTPRRRTCATACTRRSPRRSGRPTTSTACRTRSGTTTTSTAWRRPSTC